jgi:hypothetical protein
MNINAGISSYNLNLKKNKEEKRPTFATIFDKLDARSKKLNSKNPLNAVLTNEQQYRYYLQETEPMLHNNDDTFDLDDVVGNKSLKDMKLSEFAKLLSGNLENDVSNRYETLQAIVSSNASAPLVPSSITISSTPAPAPVVPPPATPAPAPAAAPAPPPSGSSGTGTAPSAAAPSAAAPPPSGGGGGSGTAPAAAPAAAPSAAPAGSGLSVAIPPAGSGGGSTPTGSTAGGIVSGIASAASGLLSSAKSLLSSPKPSPSGTSVPSSAVASASTTAPATGVPTATPASGASSPAAAGSSPAAAAGSSLTAAEIAAASMTSAELAGHKKKEDIEAYIDGVNKGLNPPEKPASLKGAIDIEDKEWVRYTIALITHNKMADKPFSLSAKQQQIAKNYEQALATTADKSDIESIIQNTIIIAQTPKPKSGKGGNKKKK